MGEALQVAEDIEGTCGGWLVREGRMEGIRTGKGMGEALQSCSGC